MAADAARRLLVAPHRGHRPDRRADQRRAATSLRAALHRLPHPAEGPPVLAGGGQLVLSDAVQVDVDELGRRSVDPPQPDDGATLRRIGALERDVLPDWYEEWVVAERERFRQLRLHALESLAERLTRSHRYGLAVHAALAAVQAEPLRESAHRAVIEAHLAQGNVGEAVRQYRACQHHLVTELAISPSPQLQELVFGRRR